ncbi:MAG: hypothetical protein C0520_11325 [Sphingopyxis sp.]|nr:hypothetical protein [Sphingopyxis sp.]
MLRGMAHYLFRTGARFWRLAIAAAALLPVAAGASTAVAGPAAGDDCRGAGGFVQAALGPDLPLPAAREAPSALERMRLLQQGGLPAEPARDVRPEASPRPSADICAVPRRARLEPAYPPAAGADSHSDSELGTLAIPIDRTRFDDRWDRVRRAPAASLMRSALRRAGVTRDLGDAEILRRVNQWVNRRIAYVDDDRNYGQSDFWATAEQTIARGRGDCEDFAILKMQMLAAAGIDRDRVKLVLLRDLALNADHAFLLVQSAQGRLVLDNMTDQLYDGSRANDVRPILSFSGARRWVHGYLDARPVLVAATPPAGQGGGVPAIPSFRAGSRGLVEPGFRSIRLSMVQYRPVHRASSALPFGL